MNRTNEILGFLEKKYGRYVTDKLVTEGKVFKENGNDNGREEQVEVMKHIKGLSAEGEKILPENFSKNDVKWGMDFSSWLGTLEKKKTFMFIGAEPHLSKNYQLVYDFGSHKGMSIDESAEAHYSRENDIWHYLTKIFVEDLTPQKITDFLNQCYITDLSHIVPKDCGQVKTITTKLGITTSQWNKFRTKVANKFIPDEINAVDPKYVILHGNASRNYFKKVLRVNFAEHDIDNSTFKILEGQFNGYKIISIPHLKGDMRNKLWKCKKHPTRIISATKILRKLVNQEK